MLDDAILEATKLLEEILEGTTLLDEILEGATLDDATLLDVVVVLQVPKSAHALLEAQPTPGS